MGFRESLVRGLALSASHADAGTLTAPAGSDPSRGRLEAGLRPAVTELASPWASPSPALSSILWTDVLGPSRLAPLTRETAMGVPALARARHLVCGTGASTPIQVWRAPTLAAQQPRWTYSPAAGLPAYHRMLWTLDDLLFHGWSLWEVERSTPDGPITGEAARVAAHRWSFTAEGSVLVDGQPFPAGRALLIPGPHEGLLLSARTAITQAAELEASATRVAQNPAAYLDLHYSGDVPLDDTQIQQLIDRWSAARRGDNGGVAYTSKDVEVRELGSAAEHLLVEGRNAAAVNMARVASVPAALVDATNAGASLTYETTAGRNAEFLDYGLDLYLDSIAARLSMDDVVGPGLSVRFDTTELRTVTPSPTGPVTED